MNACVTLTLDPDTWLRDPDIRCLDPIARCLLLDMKALYSSLGEVQDSPEWVAKGIQWNVRTVRRWWRIVREFFQPFGEVLVDPTIEAQIIRKSNLTQKRQAAANCLWNQRRGNASAEQVQSKCITHAGKPLVHDMEHATHGGAQAGGVVFFSTKQTKEKESESAKAASTQEASGKIAKPRKAKVVSPEEAFVWTPAMQHEMELARKEYPSNLRRSPDRTGRITKCLPGTSLQTVASWTHILANNPDVTALELRACLFCYLDEFDLDAKEGVDSWLVNLLSFYSPEREQWREYLAAARKKIKKQVVPLDLPNPDWMKGEASNG